MLSRAAWRTYAELDPRVWLMAGVRAANVMALSLVMAFMAIYLVTERGATASMYGVIALVANLCQALAHGYAGELSDHMGRRQLMVRSLTARAVVFALLGIAVIIDAPLWLLAATLVASAVLRGGFEPVAYALVADIVRPEQRVAAFGLQRMGANLGWALGPAMGGLLREVLGYGAVFFWTAALLFGVAWLTNRVADPGQRARPPQSGSSGAAGGSLGQAFVEALRRTDMTVLLVASFLMALIQMQLFSTLGIYAASELDFSSKEVGLMFAANGLAVIVLQVPAVAWILRLGAYRALLVGALGYVLGFVAMGMAAGLGAAVLAIVVITAGEVMLAPAHQTVASELADPARMGRAFGLVGTLQMLGVAVGPLVGGMIYDGLGGQHVAMWSALAALPVLLLGILLVLAWSVRRVRNPG